MTSKKMKKTVLLFYGTALLLMIVFAVADLQISIAFDQPQSLLWRFFEAFGEWPLNTLAALAAIFLWKTEKKDTKLARFVAYWCWGLTALVGAAMAGSLPLYFMLRDSNHDFPLWIVLAAPVALAICVLLVRQYGPKATPESRPFALACVYYFWGALGLAHSMKILWGRVRFRELSEPFSGFTAWYLPQGNTGNFSFPSGHAIDAAAALLLVLLPRVFPAIKIKPGVLTSLAAVWLVLVAVSRVGLGAHYASDVTVGATLGVTLFLVLKFRFFDRHSN